MNDFDGTLNKSLDDFMESYKITDTEKIYSNGIEFVPIFRVKQWEEYNNKDKEIERLNNIINELEECLESVYSYDGIDYTIKRNGKYEIVYTVDEVKEWIQELKGSDKE